MHTTVWTMKLRFLRISVTIILTSMGALELRSKAWLMALGYAMK